ncbi:hypothetical protein [Streptomyces sp. NPDC058045]|uniref:hypothetical protein n=1 Tax=Streptomyces sp. NPDC058045 TaxID=3346311 RepID=UPI0036EE3520
MSQRKYPSPRWRLARGRLLWAGVTVFLVAASGAAYLLVRAQLPEVGAGLYWLFAAGGVPALMMAAFSVLHCRRLPAIDPVARTARVTGITRHEEEPDTVRVRVQGRDGEFLTVLADHIHPDHEHRFAAGSEWQVYVFERSRDRVLLAERHEDALRQGWNLGGLRMADENGGSTGYGSELPAWGFRRPAGGPDPTVD